METPSAQERAFNTVELVEQILLSLPLPLFLQSRRVSKLWRELILRSRRYKTLQSDPHLEVVLDVCPECSIREQDAPTLTANMTLHFDRPVPIEPPLPPEIAKLAEVARAADATHLEPDPFQENAPYISLKRSSDRVSSGAFSRSEMGAFVIYPGELYRVRWNIRPKTRYGGVPDAGSVYVLGKEQLWFRVSGCLLWDDLEVEWEPARLSGELKALDSLRLAWKNKVRFRLVP